MEPVALDELKAFASGLDGHTLLTLGHQQPFSVKVDADCVVCTPDRSGIPRRETWDDIETILVRFNETRSYHPGDYIDLTRNASYIMSILHRYSERIECDASVDRS